MPNRRDLVSKCFPALKANSRPNEEAPMSILKTFIAGIGICAVLDLGATSAVAAPTTISAHRRQLRREGHRPEGTATRGGPWPEQRRDPAAARSTGQDGRYRLLAEQGSAPTRGGQLQGQASDRRIPDLRVDPRGKSRFRRCLAAEPAGRIQQGCQAAGPRKSWRPRLSLAKHMLGAQGR